MRENEITELKKLSADLLEAMPGKLLVDGSGQFFVAGEEMPIETTRVLSDIDHARAVAKTLNEKIQAIQGRAKKAE